MTSTRVTMSRLDDPGLGSVSTGILAALVRARQAGASACVLRPASAAHSELFSLVPDGVKIVDPDGLDRWTRARWEARQTSIRARQRIGTAAAAFWRELSLELRRHASDERFPQDFRRRLRNASQSSMARSSARERVREPLPRRLLNERVPMRLPEPLLGRARESAARLGIRDDARLVALDADCRPETLEPAARFLLDEGCTLVRIGGGSAGTRSVPHVLDTRGLPDAPLVTLFALLAAELLVCDNTDAQRLAYLTNTPTLTINATDVFAFYPVRDDGVYLLKTAIDLDTGRELPPLEMLSEPYFRNLRNCGYRACAAGDVLAAVREMYERRRPGWREHDAQTAFRARVVAAGEELAPRVARAAAWGPDGGFIGEGRLARVQAERVS